MSRANPGDLPETLSLLEDDPCRAAMEATLEAVDIADLRALWLRTRAAAAAARRKGDIDRVIVLVRGLKTIQRIADRRGTVFTSRSQA